MADQRKKDVDWAVANAGGVVQTWEQVQVAMLMDIRDELKRLNAAIYCHNFQAIPRTLSRIADNTRRPRKKKATRMTRRGSDRARRGKPG